MLVLSRPMMARETKHLAVVEYVGGADDGRGWVSIYKLAGARAYGPSGITISFGGILRSKGAWD